MYELATGLEVIDKSRPNCKLLKDYIKLNITGLNELIDKKAGWIDWFVAENLIKIGMWCSLDDADKRPDMLTVFNALDRVTKS